MGNVPHCGRAHQCMPSVGRADCSADHAVLELRRPSRSAFLRDAHELPKLRGRLRSCPTAHTYGVLTACLCFPWARPRSRSSRPGPPFDCPAHANCQPARSSDTVGYCTNCRGILLSANTSPWSYGPAREVKRVPTGRSGRLTRPSSVESLDVLGAVGADTHIRRWRQCGHRLVSPVPAGLARCRAS